MDSSFAHYNCWHQLLVRFPWFFADLVWNFQNCSFRRDRRIQTWLSNVYADKRKLSCCSGLLYRHHVILQGGLRKDLGQRICEMWFLHCKSSYAHDAESWSPPVLLHASAMVQHSSDHEPQKGQYPWEVIPCTMLLGLFHYAAILPAKQPQR